MKWICRATIFTIVGLLATQGFAESPRSNPIKKYRAASIARTTKAMPVRYHGARSSTVVVEQDYDSHCSECGGGCAHTRCVHICICPIEKMVGFVDRSLKAIFTLPCHHPCFGLHRRPVIGDCFGCGHLRHSRYRSGCAECGHELGAEYEYEYDSDSELMLPTPEPTQQDTAPIPPAAAAYRRHRNLVQPISGKRSVRRVKTLLGPPLAHARRSTQQAQRETTSQSVRQISYDEPASLKIRSLADAQPVAAAKRVAPVSRTPYRPVPRPTVKKKTGLRFLND